MPFRAITFRQAISLARIDPTGADRDELIAFMTGQEFPFHVRARPGCEDVERSIAEGGCPDEENDSFWVDHDELGRIAFLRFEDLTDDAPLFDLRLRKDLRAK